MAQNFQDSKAYKATSTNDASDQQKYDDVPHESHMASFVKGLSCAQLMEVADDRVLFERVVRAATSAPHVGAADDSNQNLDGDKIATSLHWRRVPSSLRRRVRKSVRSSKAMESKQDEGQQNGATTSASALTPPLVFATCSGCGQQRQIVQELGMEGDEIVLKPMSESCVCQLIDDDIAKDGDSVASREETRACGGLKVSHPSFSNQDITDYQERMMEIENEVRAPFRCIRRFFKWLGDWFRFMFCCFWY